MISNIAYELVRGCVEVQVPISLAKQGAILNHTVDPRGLQVDGEKKRFSDMHKVPDRHTIVDFLGCVSRFGLQEPQILRVNRLLVNSLAKRKEAIFHVTYIPF